MLDYAIKYFQKCLQLNPSNQACYIHLGNVFYNKGLLDKAIELYKKCLITNITTQNKEQLYYNLSIAFHDKGNIKQMFKIYLQQIGLRKENANFYNNIGNYYLQQKDIIQAINQYKLCLKLKPAHQICKQNIEIAKAKRKQFPRI
ncbi:hypothetical protein ABPG72_008244 [Tetrahymena utriculariae]